MPRINEKELILPSLSIIDSKNDKKINTSELISELRILLNPGEEDTQILQGRKDDKFSQKVRNLRAHRTLDKYTNYVDNFFVLTKEGKKYLDENREQLKLIVSEENFLDEINSPVSTYYESFNENIENTKKLLLIKEVNKKKYYLNLLFSSIISNLEAYLYDSLKFNIFNDESDVFLQKFIETYKKYEDEKYFYSDIYKEFYEKENKVEKEINRLSYHRLNDIELIFNGVFDIKFSDITFLKKKIFVRHDLIHRSGRKNNGEIHEITEDDILELCKETEFFVLHIHKQFEVLNANNT